MELDLGAMAPVIGVSVPVLRFLLCFVATIPVSFFWRLVPGGPPAKNLYAAASGVILSYLSFGFSSNLHFLVPMSIGYSSMLLYRRRCGLITFFLALGYLIGCHVYYMSGDAWKEGGIDATGALMVLTLKVISCAINYNDGLLKEENLREAQKKNRLQKLPSLVEYFGYCLCCGSHFAGPVFEIKDYLEWTERKGIWAQSKKGQSPSPYWPTLKALFQAALCMSIYLYLVPQFPLSHFTDPVYQEWGFWKRLGYQYMSAFTARWKYYFIWSISEASMIISGLGFSGWTDSTPPKPLWDYAKNVNILGVELVKSSVELPLVWNIQVSTWLRHYVYERLLQKGKKPGFFQLLATQTVSAVWHQKEMMTMKHKSTGMFMTGKGSTAAGGGVMEAALALALEIRPGGMLVQKRNSDSDHSSIPVPTIKVKVKYGSSYLEFSISSQASFGDLKKMVAGPTGVHHEDQKLIFKDKERESKSFLDVAGVKDGSKMVLIEDVISRERRCLELRRNAKMDKASKEIAEISLEVDKFAKQVANLESQIYGGKGVVEKVLLNLIEQLMTQLIKLDGIVADGDVKLRRRFQVKRVQKYIETLDMLKVKNSMIRAEEAKIEPMQKISTGQMPINPIQKQQPVVVTTKWETFDTGMSPPAIKPNNNAASYKQSWEYFV